MNITFSSNSVKLFYSFLILIQVETHILLIGFFISKIYFAGKIGKGENYLLSSPKAIEEGGSHFVSSMLIFKRINNS